jgi:hypothetical protein
MQIHKRERPLLIAMIKPLAWILFFLPILISCSPTRKITRAPLKEEGTEYLIQQLKNHEFKYNWITAKFSADYTFDKKRTSFNGQIRIRKDSVIWISISPVLGIEMMRLLITNDSVKYLNRLESTFYSGSFQFINKLINNALDFDMLQAFLTGNDFSFYENSKFRASIDNQEYKLTTIQRHKLRKYLKDNQDEIIIPLQDIWLDPDHFKISRVLVREALEGNRKFEANYSDYVDIGGQFFPSSLLFNIEVDGEKIFLNIKYSKIIIDQPAGFPCNIPEKYTRIL